MFEEGFPERLNDSYMKVISLLPYEAKIADGYDSENEIYYLSDGSKIRFPYRLYCADDEAVYDKLSELEKRIYDCIFVRHCEGHVREKHIEALLDSELQEWHFPYILRLSSEYVFEIVEMIYEGLKDRDNSLMQEFCHNNPQILKRAYIRMTSYWDCYYKDRFPRFDHYVGYRLFKECFSPDTDFEKL